MKTCFIGIGYYLKNYFLRNMFVFITLCLIGLTSLFAINNKVNGQYFNSLKPKGEIAVNPKEGSNYIDLIKYVKKDSPIKIQQVELVFYFKGEYVRYIIDNYLDFMPNHRPVNEENNYKYLGNEKKIFKASSEINQVYINKALM